jgi:microcin C transport system permease protein
MLAYIIRRLLLMIPTLLGIMVLNFVVIQFAPGRPIEQILAQLQGTALSATARFSGEGTEVQSSAPKTGAGSEVNSSIGAPRAGSQVHQAARGPPGFDSRPMCAFDMIRSYVVFDFGKSFFKDRSVIDLVLEKMPVSISIGLWTTLIGYLVSIPLGIAKATREGSRFDAWTTTAITAGSAIPGFLFAILLIVVFAGGRYLDWFPLRGLTSPNWHELSWPARILDYLWHMTLPIVAMVTGSFASLTLLTKNSFLDQMRMLYVSTARAKGLNEQQVLYGHVFRNAMLIVISGFPGAVISIFFGSALLIETIFSLDGLGLLGYEAAINRDYPIMFATLYFFSLLGLIVNLVGDLTYTLVDPRIDFERRDV